MGRSGSSVVHRMPRYQKVAGSNPGVGSFFLLSKLEMLWALILCFLVIPPFPTFLQQWSVLNQVPQGGASLLRLK